MINFPQLSGIISSLLGGLLVAVPYSIEGPALSKFISTIKTESTGFCAKSLTCSSVLILLICVYLPTNYGTSQSHDLYLEVIGDLKGFIETQTFDKVSHHCWGL